MNESKDVPRRESSQNGRYAGRYSKQVPARRKRRKVNPLFIAVVALAAILIGLIIFLIIGSNKQDKRFGIKGGIGFSRSSSGNTQN